MSSEHGIDTQDTKAASTAQGAPIAGDPPDNALAGLMAQGPTAASPAAPGPDLEQQALRAAAAAVAAGERAVAAAEAELQRAQAAAPAGRPGSSKAPSGRERLLRALLAVNLLAMVVVLLLPEAQSRPSGPTADVAGSPQHQPTTAPEAPTTSPMRDPWNRALVAADRGDYRAAIAILEAYLADSPRLSPRIRLSTLMALEHYAIQVSDMTAAQGYRQRADALSQSHHLPEDLLAMAKAAKESGDQEALRRLHARFLLQQRQIPNWLHQHLAEAYLELGDSYREEAAAAAEVARRQQLEAVARALREQAEQAEREEREGPR